MATFSLTLDTKKGQWVGTPVRVRNGDEDSCTVIATITEGGARKDLTGLSATFEAVKPDRTVVQDGSATVSAEAGTITYTLNKSVAQAPGECSAAYFRLTDAAGTWVDSTQSFVLVVESGTTAGSLSTDYVQRIETMVALLEAQKQKYAEAEALRVTGENGRVAAEDARVGAEDARKAAEARRVGAESGRVGAETARATAEAARAKAEEGRASAEESRASAETARAHAEEARATAEAARVTAEAGRSSAEDVRKANETARVAAEGARSSAEDARAKAETSRSDAEAARAQAEAARKDAEAKRVVAEDGRSGAEARRATAETARGTAEGKRDAAEALRTTAETARATAEDARAKAETTRAQSQTANDTAQAKNNADQAANNAAALGMTFVILSEGQYDKETTEPTVTGENGKMYLVPDPDGSKDNVYREWIWVGGGWECIGSSATSFDPISTDTIDAVASGSAPSGDEGLSTTGLSYLWAKLRATFAALAHKHTRADITDFPSSMPASDVSSWAKQPQKPAYAPAEVGAAPASHTHAMADVTGLAGSIDALQPRSSYVTVTIQPADWSGNSCTKAADGVTASSVVYVSAAPESEQAASEAHVWCTAQGDGSLTFRCGDVPSDAITLNIESKEA